MTSHLASPDLRCLPYVPSRRAGSPASNQTFARLTRGGAADSSILRGVGMSTWRKVRRAERVQLELVSLDADPARDGVAYTVRVRNCGSAQAAGVVVHLVTAG